MSLSKLLLAGVDVTWTGVSAAELMIRLFGVHPASNAARNNKTAEYFIVKAFKAVNCRH